MRGFKNNNTLSLPTLTAVQSPTEEISMDVIDVHELKSDVRTTEVSTCKSTRVMLEDIDRNRSVTDLFDN